MLAVGGWPVLHVRLTGRHRAQQFDRVRVGRRGEEPSRRSQLDYASPIEHGNVVGQLAHNGKVMGDEEEACLVDNLDIFQKIYYLRLYGTSSAEVGSSQISSSARTANERAMASRWHWPPLNW